MNLFAELAPKYWTAGLPAIPLRFGEKRPTIMGWQQYADRLPTDCEKSHWLSGFPDGNIGLALGPQSGVFIIDIDTVDAKLANRIESALPPSPWRRVGAKGCALAYRWTEGCKKFKLKCSSGSMAVEGLGQGHQIVLPGSIHPDTRMPYTANSNLWEVLDQLTVLPSDIVEQLTALVNPTASTLSVANTCGSSEAVSKGGRHNALTSLAGRLFNDGLGPEELHDKLMAWNRKFCNPPQDVSDIDQIVASAFRDWSKREPKLLTDMANGERLAERLTGRAVYISEARDWFFFDGVKWQRDPGNLIAKEAKAVAHEIYRQTQASGENLKGAARPQSSAALKNMIELARSEDGMMQSIDNFDTDHHFLNTPSGIVDLRTATLRPPASDGMFMQSTCTPYVADAPCPSFERFIAGILPDEAERSFAQRFLGYSLTGEISEQKFLIASGAGANGKSTLLNAVTRVMGDYAKSTPMSTFLPRASGAATNDLATLKGARLVLASEGNRGQRMDNALIKQMVGGDAISARFLHKEFFTYVPTYKPVLISNHLPELDPMDSAIWRRILVLPFKQCFMGREDNELSAKLNAELPGILRWLVEGASLWYESGLAIPQSIVEATKTYRAEVDVIGSFITECCDEGSAFEVEASNLYYAYVSYCRSANAEAVTQTCFGRDLTRRRFPEKKNSRIFRLNIRLKPLGHAIPA